MVLDRSTGKLALYQATSGSFGSALGSVSVTIADSTAYTIKVERKQRQVHASMVGQGEFTYDGSTDFGTGQSGCYSDKTSVTFDDFKANDATAREALTPRFSGMADAAISGGVLNITGTTRGGEAVLDNFNDDDYMIEATYSPGANFLAVWFRYQDANNSYRLNIKEISDRRMTLQKIVDGKATSLASAVQYSLLDFQKFSVKVNGTSLKVWHDGTCF